MKVSLLAAISVDGRIAENSDQLADWTSHEDKKFFVTKTKEAGVIVMGRKTYETIGRPLPGRLNVIMTRDVSGHENIADSLEYTSSKPQEILADLEQRGFVEVVIAGGAEIYSIFLREKLVTDLYLTVEPVIFGDGVPLVSGGVFQKLNLVSSEKLGEKAILLHYQTVDVL